ncbi:MAG: hypothetical protein ACKVJN_18205 [Woeseiales bacterium]|jgi:hypothetical protein
MNDDALREIPRVYQRDAEAKRRWFTCSRMDVFLWEDLTGEIVGFQLAYDKPHAEQVISWRFGERAKSSTVLLDGPSAGRHPGTPLLVASGRVDGWSVCGRLIRFNGDLPGHARNTLCRIIANAYGNQAEPVQTPSQELEQR